MDELAGRNRSPNGDEEADELLTSVALHAAPDAVATRYEKTAASFMGVLCLAATLDRLKR